MVFRGSLVRVGDNSGVRVVRVICSCLRFGEIGPVVVRKSLRLRKGTLYPGLLIRARAKSKILGGGFLGRSNRVVLLRKRDSRASKRADIVPVGKRVWYSLPLSFRKRGGFSKLVAIAPGFIG